ncbi:putative ribosome biogenesis GTPase RsgA [Enhygromyxa salina]|uniref:Small ribosomal subunit biogenesis GTPase RsgA n=1 Tax=Enhygromyxa salina TaxID=215803 RepID=A0A2S9XX16_9BACT|nr:ribosome small subunit-dependent GTPase A [Enhygromyxa salina]PRP97405.1 putative ribosome biogenesis GTPase RsgA [Enhygromyxa salina]
MTAAPHDLEALGWDDRSARTFKPWADAGLVPARVLVEHREHYRVATNDAELPAEVSGRFRHDANARVDFPAVGDFVAVELPESDGPAMIHAVVPRRSVFMRQSAGEQVEAQVVAANIDVLFIVTAFNHDLNLRRLERYLTLAWESGARPVILINKVDLCDDVDAVLADVAPVALSVPVHPLSALASEGVEAIEQYLEKGKTIGLIGSSGVGKSTLINQLIGGAVQATKAVREADSRGRHTTTHRELFVLPRGGMLIDTPGMRELQLWVADEGLDATFQDIGSLARECRFKDCRHEREPGCAVRAAAEAGELDADRLASYEKLGRELDFVHTRTDKQAASKKKKSDKAIHRAMKRFNKKRS